VRDLMGHTSRSLSTVETYLDVASADSGPVDLADAVAYYLAITSALADTAAVVQRGRAAGAALGEDPMAALSALVVRVPDRVRATPATALVRTPFGTMTLEGYLPTRTLELTVHTCDLAAALGVSADVPQDAVADAFTVIGGLAAVQGTASAALLALTGRLPLPAGYSVLSPVTALPLAGVDRVRIGRAKTLTACGESGGICNGGAARSMRWLQEIPCRTTGSRHKIRTFEDGLARRASPARKSSTTIPTRLSGFRSPRATLVSTSTAWTPPPRVGRCPSA
jgi:hypothetical protein